MPLTKQQKRERVAEVQDNLTTATSAVFMAYDGLTVDDVEELRDTLFAQGSRLRVVPKRLLRLALQQAELDFDPTAHEGQVAIIWGSDAVAPAKVLHAFAKTHENLRILGGTLEKKMLSLEQVQALAQLPSREQLLGQLVSVLVGPLRGFQYVLTGAQRQLVYALQAVADSRKS
jgi:large subunit ribosomal protein L10